MFFQYLIAYWNATCHVGYWTCSRIQIFKQKKHVFKQFSSTIWKVYFKYEIEFLSYGKKCNNKTNNCIFSYIYLYGTVATPCCRVVRIINRERIFVSTYPRLSWELNIGFHNAEIFIDKWNKVDFYFCFVFCYKA